MDTASIEFMISGIIMMLVIGPAVGNYATSVVYRLPFGETPFERNPYCGDCNTMLQPKDLFPILSFLSTKGKCRYCGVKIRPSYTWVEAACGIVFVAGFIVWGVSEQFILITALATFLITLAALEYHEKKLFVTVWTWCAAVAAGLRILEDGSIYPMVQSAFLMLFVAVILWRVCKPGSVQVPALVWMAALCGIVFPVTAIAPTIIIAALVYVAQRIFLGWRFTTTAFACGIWGGLLANEFQLIG